MTNGMTEIEALEDIVDSGINLGAGDFVDVEALKVAVKALEKQIPKKPIMKTDSCAYFCPCCNGHIRSIYTRKEIILDEHIFCGRCGQKLDWE